MVYIAELEEESLDALAARERTLSSVRTAGLKKTTSTLGTIKRVPRLSHSSASVITSAVGLDVPDAAIFL